MDLQALTSLQVGSNRLSNLATFEHNRGFEKLREFGAWQNLLHSIPTGLGRLTELRGLYLFSNKLTKLPSQIGNLGELHSLILYDNLLTAVPVSFARLTKLELVLLSRNKLVKMPYAIVDNGQQFHLDLQQNEISVSNGSLVVATDVASPPSRLILLGLNPACNKSLAEASTSYLLGRADGGERRLVVRCEYQCAVRCKSDLGGIALCHDSRLNSSRNNRRSRLPDSCRRWPTWLHHEIISEPGHQQAP